MWARALLGVCQNPDAHRDVMVYCDKDTVVIRDKYPKAAVHLLAMPRASADTGAVPFLGPLDLRTRAAAATVRTLVAAARKALEKEYPDVSEEQVRFGFHMKPSMQPLHLHAISTDFAAPAMRTAKHWNSFTTDFFVQAEPYACALEACADDSAALALCEATFGNKARAEALLKSPLRCHRCNEAQRTMPKLKDHVIRCAEPVARPERVPPAQQSQKAAEGTTDAGAI